MQYTRLVFSLYALVLTLWRLGAYSVASYLNWHQNCSNFRNPVVGKKQLSSAYLCRVFKLQCCEVFIYFSAKRVGITQQPCRSLEIAKNKLIKMDYMLWEDSFKKRYNKRAFMLSDGNDCSFGNDILSVHSRWQAFNFARQSGCSLLEASFLDWFIPGMLCRS